MNTYYHSDTSAEVEAIVRDGFIDHMEHKRSGMRGVYIADAPGEPDPDYPDDQLLEITLPAEIDCSQWELAAPARTPEFPSKYLRFGALPRHAFRLEKGVGEQRSKMRSSAFCSKSKVQ
jgi:hypothetical protein